MNFLAMRPSEWRELAKQPDNMGLNASLISSIEAFLKSYPSPQGNGPDEIYVTAIELGNAGIWDRLDPKLLAKAISAAAEPALKAFLDGIPSETRALILDELRNLSAQKPKQVKTRTQELRTGMRSTLAPKPNNTVALTGENSKGRIANEELRRAGFNIVRELDEITFLVKVPVKKNPYVATPGRSWLGAQMKPQTHKTFTSSQIRKKLENMGFSVGSVTRNGTFHIKKVTENQHPQQKPDTRKLR